MSIGNGPLMVSITPANGGSPIRLESTGYAPLNLLEGVEGLGIPAVEHKTGTRPGGHGALLRATQVKEREIFLPLMLWGHNQERVLQTWGELIDAVSPTEGLATLTVQLPGGTPRMLQVAYKDGLKGDFGEKYRKTWMKAGLTLVAFDPFFRGAETLVSWAPKAKDPKHFISTTQPFFPVVLSPSAVGESTEVMIGGQYPVKPVWSITGPVTDVKVTHVETGAFFLVHETFKPGEFMVIDVASMDVFDSEHTRGELWDRMDEKSTLFELAPGKNTIRVEAANMTDSSAIQLVYQPAYLRGI